MTNKGAVHTPLLVPSFSSKGFPDHLKIMALLEEALFTPSLVSAYDIYYEQIEANNAFPRFDTLPLLIVDSGGYEANSAAEFSDIPKDTHAPKPWTEDMHAKALAAFQTRAPVAYVTYDHPKQRHQFDAQVRRAQEFRAAHKDIPVIFLLKPETFDEEFVRIDALRRHVNGLGEFAAIGVTEDEAGRSLVDRMVFIAKLRAALDAAGIDAPIHVFGSLDTLITLMYFAAGADVFDGLTWLRYALHKDETIYRRHHPILTENFDRPWGKALSLMWYDNYSSLTRLQNSMERFANSGDFSGLPRGDLVQKAVVQMNAKLGS